MYRIVLIALDGSKNAEKVLPPLEPVLQAGKARALLVQVLPSGEPSPEAAAEAYLDSVAARLSKKQIHADTETVRGDPAVAIIRTAERKKVDLVAFTSHGQGGVGQWVFGSVAQKILRGCARPLFVVRGLEEPCRKIRRVLVPLDGSVGSEATVPHAAALAKAAGAAIRFLYVAPPPGIEAGDSKLRGWLDREKRRIGKRLEEIAAAQGKIPAECILDEGDPAARIVDRAGAEPDTVIAMGSHGRTGFSRWVYGSVAEKVLQAARGPVLIARHTET